MDFNKFQEFATPECDNKAAHDVCVENMIGAWVSLRHCAELIEHQLDTDIHFREDILHDLGNMLRYIAKMATALDEPLGDVAWRGLGISILSLRKDD